MLSPYSGPAAATFDRVHNDSYYTNKLYKLSDNKYYFINTKGYMHFYLIDRIRFQDKIYFYISHQMLTKDNTLKEVGVMSTYYENLSSAIDKLNELVQEDAA